MTAQLLRADTLATLWADKFDGSLEDIFDLQDRIADQIVGLLEPRLQRSEIERATQTRPRSLDAYSLYLEGARSRLGAHASRGRAGLASARSSPSSRSRLCPGACLGWLVP